MRRCAFARTLGPRELPPGSCFLVASRRKTGDVLGEGKPAPVIVESNKSVEGIAIVLKRME